MPRRTKAPKPHTYWANWTTGRPACAVCGTPIHPPMMQYFSTHAPTMNHLGIYQCVGPECIHRVAVETDETLKMRPMPSGTWKGVGVIALPPTRETAVDPF